MTGSDDRRMFVSPAGRSSFQQSPAPPATLQKPSTVGHSCWLGTKSQKIAAIVDATLQIKPAWMTHSSCRSMAERQGVGKSTVNNIWRAHKLQPHRTKTFKPSRHPERMTEVVGLYLNPPQQAPVLCLDEKSQIQTLDRTRPGLPIKRAGAAPDSRL
jgi:hypothetical protein